MAIEKKKNATAAWDILQRFSDPCVILLLSKYSLFLQEWALIPTASTAPAVNINTKFKKSSVASMIGHASGSKKLANIPYIESVVIPQAAANIVQFTRPEYWFDVFSRAATKPMEITIKIKLIERRILSASANILFVCLSFLIGTFNRFKYVSLKKYIYFLLVNQNQNDRGT